MSHYAVAVFSDDGDFDRLLEPYNENDKSYFVFQPVEYSKIEGDFANFKKNNKNWTLEGYIDLFNYIQQDDQWGYMHNPRGYWDWYSLDGKDYMFDLKEGVEMRDGEWDFRKNDYDWYPNNYQDGEDAKEFWDSFIGDDAIAEPPGLWNKQYFLDRFKTREQYVKEALRTVPYAFITPDGEWHSPGNVGAFATSDETYEDWNRYVIEWDKWIADESNPYVNLVDCHV